MMLQGECTMKWEPEIQIIARCAPALPIGLLALPHVLLTQLLDLLHAYFTE
jgi:hypothetical protein